MLRLVSPGFIRFPLGGILNEALKSEDLEFALRHMRDELIRLRIDPESVRLVREALENPEGGVSRVFEADTRYGDAALRIDFAYPAAVATVLMNFLGRAHLTPRLFGLIEGQPLTRLMQSHRRLATIRTPWPEYPDSVPVSGMVMEKIDGGWNILRTQKPSRTPPEIHSWCQEDLLAQVKMIQDTLTELGVQLLDPQFLISRRGQVKLIDLEHCVFIDSEDNYWAYGGITTERYAPWVKSRDRLKNDFVDDFRRELERRRNA